MENIIRDDHDLVVNWLETNDFSLINSNDSINYTNEVKNIDNFINNSLTDNFEAGISDEEHGTKEIAIVKLDQLFLNEPNNITFVYDNNDLGIINTTTNVDHNLSVSLEDCDDLLKDKTWTPEMIYDNINNHSPSVLSGVSEIKEISHISKIPNNFDILDNNPAAIVVNNNTPIKKSKKRCRNTNMWKREVKKTKRNLGESYKTVKGLEKPAKKLLVPCDQKCRIKCTEKINEDDRKTIFSQYWALGDINRQRDFINHHSESVQPKYQYKKLNSTRANNLQFFFIIKKNSPRIQVCKKFFKATLNINDTNIATARRKVNESGSTERDKRGKHTENRITVSEEDKIVVRNHINSYPRIESHYLRNQTTREFIDGSLTLSEMYRMYIEFCGKENITPVKKYLYENIFNYEFNIGFFSPKKDQCSTCEEYKNTITKTVELEEKFEKHIKNKEDARNEIIKDTDTIKTNNNNGLYYYDLQAVLPTPSGEVSSFYYKRRLATYNFTIFESNSNEGHCFIWNESVGNRGAIEIGSCIIKFMEKFVTDERTMLTFYSDNCNGQNKNRYIYTVYMYIVMFLNVSEITHKFLTTGHTQMPVDSMHSTIEKQKKRALKSGPVYIPAQWVSIIKLAKKKGKPYSTTEMDTKDFIDLTNLCNDIGTNYSINESGEKILMSDIVAINFKKEKPFILHYKTDFSQNDYKTINIRSYGKRNQCYPNKNDIVLKNAYTYPPKISKTKKEDLISLCRSNLIPEQYHYFFEHLTTEKSGITPQTNKQIQNKTVEKTDKITVKITKKKILEKTEKKNVNDSKTIKKSTIKKKLFK